MSRRSRRRLTRSESAGRADSYRLYNPPVFPYKRVMPRPVVRPLVDALVSEAKRSSPTRSAIAYRSSRRLADVSESGPTAFARRVGLVPAKRPERIITPPAKPLYKLAFSNPKLVAECLRRRMRKEVLHALGIAGRKGLSGRGGGYRRTPASEFSC